MNDSTSVAEGLLLCHPDIAIYYRLKYKIYKELNIPLELFFIEDIINYRNKKFYKIDVYINDSYPSYPFIKYQEFYNPNIRIIDDIDVMHGMLLGNKNELIIGNIPKIGPNKLNAFDTHIMCLHYNNWIFLLKTFLFTEKLSIDEIYRLETLASIMYNGNYKWEEL